MANSTREQSGSLHFARNCRELEKNDLEENKVTINPELQGNTYVTQRKRFILIKTWY